MTGALGTGFGVAASPVVKVVRVVLVPLMVTGTSLPSSPLAVNSAVNCTACSSEVVRPVRTAIFAVAFSVMATLFIVTCTPLKVTGLDRALSYLPSRAITATCPASVSSRAMSVCCSRSRMATS